MINGHGSGVLGKLLQNVHGYGYRHKIRGSAGSKQDSFQLSLGRCHNNTEVPKWRNRSKQVRHRLERATFGRGCSQR